MVQGVLNKCTSTSAVTRSKLDTQQTKVLTTTKNKTTKHQLKTSEANRAQQTQPVHTCAQSKNNASTTHAQSTEASFELSSTFASRRNASSSPRKISLTGHRFKSCERSPCDFIATGVVRETFALRLQHKTSMAVLFNEDSVFGTSMHKRLVISIRSNCSWSWSVWSHSKTKRKSGP